MGESNGWQSRPRGFESVGLDRRGGQLREEMPSPPQTAVSLFKERSCSTTGAGCATRMLCSAKTSQRILPIRSGRWIRG